MKNIISLVLLLLIGVTGFSQEKKDWSKINLTDRAGDHIMLQLSSDHWGNMPDSVSSHQSGFSRGFNFAIMMNKPFKNDPRWSFAYGIGISNSNIFFQTVDIGLNTPSSTLRFRNDSTDQNGHFKKYKLATTFLEIPLELRYTFNPEKENKSWKLAVGAKVGEMLDAHTKGKTLLNPDGSLNYNYTEKESNTDYFTTTRLCVTGRVGYGIFSAFTAFQITSFFRPGAGPSVLPYQIGLSVSGL